jgi:hypothetical protein
MLNTVHRKIRLIEGNAKCRHLKKFTVLPSDMEKTEAFLENQVNKLSSELREQAGNKMMKFFDYIKYVDNN